MLLLIAINRRRVDIVTIHDAVPVPIHVSFARRCSDFHRDNFKEMQNFSPFFGPSSRNTRANATASKMPIR